VGGGGGGGGGGIGNVDFIMLFSEGSLNERYE
jgi:hypothetical protein